MEAWVVDQAAEIALATGPVSDGTDGLGVVASMTRRQRRVFLHRFAFGLDDTLPGRLACDPTEVFTRFFDVHVGAVRARPTPAMRRMQPKMSNTPRLPTISPPPACPPDSSSWHRNWEQVRLPSGS